MKDSERGGPSLPRPRDAGPSCRLGPDRARIPAASKSRIVGISPFPSRTKMAGHDGACPLEAITVKKQAYLPVGAGPDMDHCGFKIAESLENGRSQIVWRTRNAMEHALFRPQPRENRRISKLCARGGGRTHQETDTPHRTAQCYPQARILSYNPKYLGPHRCNKNKKPSHLRGSLAGMPGLEPRMAEPESAVLPITPHPNLAGVATSKSCPSYPQPDLNRCWRRERA